MKLTNNEILQIYLDNRLIKTCVECQFAKCKHLKKYEDDFFNDLILIILEYDNEKLKKIHKENHFNAFLTRIIQNNIMSATSPFFKKYYQYDMNKEELTKKYNNIKYE